MGSFGALYYATRLQPAAVIVGKPLINVGTIAMYEASPSQRLWYIFRCFKI